MKKPIQALLMAVVAFAALLAVSCPVTNNTRTADAWALVGSAAFSADTATHVSLALDSNGTPYVAYTDASVNGAVSMQKFENGAWSLVGAAGEVSANQAASYVVLTFDGTTPYIAYVETAGVTVRKYDAAAWTPLGNAGAVSGAGSGFQYLSIRVKSGIPYVAYAQVGTSSTAVFAKKYASAGNAWSDVGGTSKPADDEPIQYLVLGFQSASSPNLLYLAYAYQDATTNTAYINLRQVDTAATTPAWEAFKAPAGVTLPGSYTISGVADYVYRNISVAVGSDLSVYLAFKDARNGNKITVMRPNPAAVSSLVLGNAGFSAGEVDYVDVTLNPQSGLPYVAFSDVGNGGKITVMRLVKGTN